MFGLVAMDFAFSNFDLVLLKFGVVLLCMEWSFCVGFTFVSFRVLCLIVRVVENGLGKAVIFRTKK